MSVLEILLLPPLGLILLEYLKHLNGSKVTMYSEKAYSLSTLYRVPTHSLELTIFIIFYFILCFCSSFWCTLFSFFLPSHTSSRIL